MPGISPDVVARLRAAEEALEEVGDLLSSIEDGEAQVVYPCRVHEEHRGCNPVFEVTHVSFQQLVQADAKATLKCGHSLILPGNMVTSKGEKLPCVWCAEDCHS